MDDSLANFAVWALEDVEQHRDDLRRFARALKRAKFEVTDETERTPPRLRLKVAAPPPVAPVLDRDGEIKAGLRDDARRAGFGAVEGDTHAQHGPPPEQPPSELRIAYIAGVLAVRPYAPTGQALAYSLRLNSKKFNDATGVDEENFEEPVKQIQKLVEFIEMKNVGAVQGRKKNTGVKQ